MTGMVEVLVFVWEEESKGQRKERWMRKFGKNLYGSCQIKHNYVKTKVHIKCISSLIIPGVTGIGEGIVIELQLG